MIFEISNTKSIKGAKFNLIINDVYNPNFESEDMFDAFEACFGGPGVDTNEETAKDGQVLPLTAVKVLDILKANYNNPFWQDVLDTESGFSINKNPLNSDQTII